MNTLPKKPIQLLNEFVQKHPILLQSALPPSEQNNTNYSFDLNTTLFHGPYWSGTYLRVEQQQADKPKFYVMWNPSDPNYIGIQFYNSTNNDVYYLEIDSTSVYLYDQTTSKSIHEYKITPENKLGEKTV